MLDKLEKLITIGAREGVSDIHLTGGHPVVFRFHGQIRMDRTQVWRPDELDDLVGGMITDRERRLLMDRKSVDLARSIRHYRVRINVFATLRGLSLAIRLLPGRVPDLDRLNLHPSLKKAAALQTGLILITGATGSGKSTTIAGIIEEINTSRAAHVVTLEDPVEYRFVSKKSFLEQREMGTHFPSFEQGLIDVLREDPDVILVGELRDAETIRLTLNAVESGHLVIASLHASNSEDALYRMANSFPPDAQDVVRTQVASTLELLVVQKLSYWTRVGYRVPVLSILKSTPAMKTVIRENKLAQLEGLIQTGRAQGMFTQEQYVAEYLEQRTQFHPPGDIFHPSEEVSDEVIHLSPLVEAPGSSVPAVSSGARSRPPSPSLSSTPSAPAPPAGPASYWDPSGRYVIAEEESMSDLLAEIDPDAASGPAKTAGPRSSPSAGPPSGPPPHGPAPHGPGTSMPSGRKEPASDPPRGPAKAASLPQEPGHVVLKLGDETPLDELIAEIRKKT
jgi:pilus retraction protein PilT